MDGIRYFDFYHRNNHYKNYLRSTMSQSRLSDLAISIESEFDKNINFDVLIDKFASLKIRKGTF